MKQKHLGMMLSALMLTTLAIAGTGYAAPAEPQNLLKSDMSMEPKTVVPLSVQNVRPSVLRDLLELPQGVYHVVAIDAQNVLLVYGTEQGVQELKQSVSRLDNLDYLRIITPDTANRPKADTSVLIEQNKIIVQQNQRIISLLEQLVNKK